MCSSDIKEGHIIEEHNYRTSQNKVGRRLSRWRIGHKMGFCGGAAPLWLRLCCNFHVTLVPSDFFWVSLSCMEVYRAGIFTWSRKYCTSNKISPHFDFFLLVCGWDFKCTYSQFRTIKLRVFRLYQAMGQKPFLKMAAMHFMLCVKMFKTLNGNDLTWSMWML